MEALPKPPDGQIANNPLQGLDHLKDLLQGSQSTEEKAKTLLELQGLDISIDSDEGTEDDEDDDPSLPLDPWDEVTVQEAEKSPQRGEPLSLRTRPTWTRPRVQNQPHSGLRPDPSPTPEIESPGHRGHSYWERLSYGEVGVSPMGVQQKPPETSHQEDFPITWHSEAKGGRNRWPSCFMFPVRGINAVGSCLWTAIQTVGGSCAWLSKPTNGKSVDQADRTREKSNGSIPRASGISQPVAVEPPRRPLAIASRPAPVRVLRSKLIRENRFEMCLKKALFEETLHISTTVLEPGWNVTGIGSGLVPLFSGWNARMDEYELRPQGRFVAQTKKAFSDFLEKVELGGEVQVFGSGGGLSTTGLPALLKRSFTPYEWLGMWRASEGRRIRVLQGLNGTNQSKSPLADDPDTLQTLENELLGLDKYMGGDSDYLTVITYSDDFVGAISLFKAELSDQHRICQLNRVAMIADVPRKVCSIFREEVKPNRYVVGRNNRKLKCYARGDLPPLQIAKITNDQDPWKCCGGGWRKALRVPNLNAEYSSGEGLLATIPHMIGLLHLQHLNLTDLHSSPALAFITPLDVDGFCQVRRGVLLNEKPQGSSHIGGNTRITVLFPRDSAWAQEQFVWA